MNNQRLPEKCPLKSNIPVNSSYLYYIVVISCFYLGCVSDLYFRMVIKPSLPLSFTGPKSEGPDCNSGAQSEQQAPEMASVKQEDCSQTLGLNVNIKDEVKEEEIETFVYHGKSRAPPVFTVC